MKRLFVCLFMVFSLMLTPVAHAAGVNCPDTGCTLADQSSKQKKQDDGKLAKAAHSCCCQHQTAPASDSGIVSLSVKYAAPFITPDDALASITLGPLLEPPSHA
jgi:hypothetical protein